jgi:hypothetical protein
MAGRGKRPEDDEQDGSDQGMAELLGWMRSFAQRKRYTRLTVEILAAIPDEELEQAVLDFVSCKLATGKGDPRKKLMSLPPAFRAVYATNALEGEVNNGGFNQFFFNSLAELAPDAVAGFDLMGVPAAARLTERAIEIRKQDEPRLKKLFKGARSIVAFSASYEGNPLGALDKELYALGDELRKARVRFIRENAELFVAE